MNVYNGATFEQTHSWSGPQVAVIGNTAVKLRWTQDPYVWHTNTGEEVFCVLDGVVHMHIREDGHERVIELRRGDVLHVHAGEEHAAYPQGVARVLVAEELGTD